jgi:predicted nucleic acid-binding protein
MVKALLDSTVLIDVLNNVQAGITEVSYYSDLAISTVTWMEVASGCTTPELIAFDAFIGAANIQVIHTSDAIARLAASIRRTSLADPKRTNIKLPDAIIGATANLTSRIVVTRNPKDFGASLVRVPYQYQYDATTGVGAVCNIQPRP